MVRQRSWKRIIVVTILMLVVFAAVPMFALAQPGSGEALDPDTQFYVAKRNQGAIEQIAELTSNRDRTGNDKESANLIRQLIETPQSVWFESGHPQRRPAGGEGHRPARGRQGHCSRPGGL